VALAAVAPQNDREVTETEERMRIAILSFEYPPETGFGGIGTYAYYQARALAKRPRRARVRRLDQAWHLPQRTRGCEGHAHQARGLFHGMLENARKARAWWFQNRVTTGRRRLRSAAEGACKKPFDFVEAPECGADAMVSTTLLSVPTAVRFHSPARADHEHLRHAEDRPRVDGVRGAAEHQPGDRADFLQPVPGRRSHRQDGRARPRST
jgi:hypothetical protein